MIHLSIIYTIYTLSKWHAIVKYYSSILSSADFAFSPASSPVIVIIPLRSKYASRQSQTPDIIIEVLNLMILSYFLHDSSFISSQFLVLDLDD